MRTGTCENCGAMVELRTVFKAVPVNSAPLETRPFALPGQHARLGLPVHLKGCAVCGAPRQDTITMDVKPSADTING